MSSLHRRVSPTTLLSKVDLDESPLELEPLKRSKSLRRPTPLGLDGDILEGKEIQLDPGMLEAIASDQEGAGRND
jgi:hypothetical protein